MTLFAVSLVPAAVLSATYGPGSWMLTLVGAFSYGTVLLGWLLGFAYLRNSASLLRLMAFYCIVTSVVLVGGPLQHYGLVEGWATLGTGVFGADWIRYGGGFDFSLIRLPSGFYRSPDVMGWHAAMVAMLASVLALTTRGGRRYFWVIVAGWAVVSLMLCGRRKMFLMLPVFFAVLIWFQWYARAAGRAVTTTGTVLGVLIVGYFAYEYLGRQAEIEQYYFTQFDQIIERVTGHGYHAVVVTLQQSGFFGEGLGTATQGTHHLNVARPRTWQEGGLSRLMVELGVPGFVCFFILVFAVLVTLARLVFRELDRQSSLYGLYTGLIAIFVANAGSFIVSHQVYGDPFIVTFFSLLVGMILSGRRFFVARVRWDIEALRRRAVST